MNPQFTIPIFGWDVPDVAFITLGLTVLLVALCAFASSRLQTSGLTLWQTAIELFGPDRAMFESNFPVDKVSSSYAVVWNAFKRITANYSPTDKARLYHDTAARVYRLA